MRKLCKPLLIFFLLLFVTSVSMRSARAQVNGIEAEIHPSSGTANTDILIKFLTTNATIGNVEKADIFWDDVSIGLNESGNQSADGSYNYHLSVPTEPPLSGVGNHTISVDSNVSNYGQVSFNFTFEITQFVPSPEYVALNASYYALLANYSNLLDNYSSLSANYSNLLANYNAFSNVNSTLLSDYRSLAANMNSVLADITSLSTNYNTLLVNYNSLQLLYTSFLANYTGLKGDYDSLNSNYNLLRIDYDGLESNYTGLKTDYETSLGELTTARNVAYVFVASTIFLAATTAYLYLRKPKLTTRAR